MRAAIYARYSSDLQSAASVEDQVRLCEERAVREGWTLTGRYADRGLSGASLMRPGLQQLLQDAMASGSTSCWPRRSTGSLATRKTSPAFTRGSASPESAS